MLRRVLPVVAGAAAVLLVPSTAVATPAPAPVENLMTGWGYTAHAEEVPLSDGRSASVTLWKYHPKGGGPSIGHLSVQLWTGYPCLEYPWPEPGDEVDPEPVPGTCRGGWTSGSVELSGAEVQLDRNLRTASVDALVEVPVSDWTPPAADDGSGGTPHPDEGEWTDPGDGGWTDPGEGEWADPGDGGWTDPGEGEWADPGDGGWTDPGGGEWADPGDGGFPPFEEPQLETVRVQVTFTGVGKLDTSATHGTVCGDGERECQSVRIDAARDGSVTGTIAGASAVQALARLTAVKGLDLAAPKFLYPL